MAAAQDSAQVGGPGSRPAIVVPAYSRPQALARLLGSLDRARYPDREVRLIVSLEGDAEPAVVDIAKGFRFAAGTVEIVQHERHLGLREHILWCGDQAAAHGSVIVLEDDLFVDPWFYRYALDALAACHDRPGIAGVALYAPRRNDYTGLPFEPLDNGTSAYPMQVACSWGQAWSAAQWAGFRAWLAAGGADALDDPRVPETVRRWPDSSWKKLFVAYLADTARSFLYPYRSYTTNCADAGGTNMRAGSQEFQVALGDPGRPYATPTFGPDTATAVGYDTFMEPRLNIDLEALSLPPGSVAVDLYGSKPVALLRQSDYCLTTRPAKAALAAFPLGFRPLPMNVLAGQAGSGAGGIRLCRSDALYDREPALARWRARLRLRRYFLAGPTAGTQLVLFGLATIFRRLADRFRRPGAGR